MKLILPMLFAFALFADEKKKITLYDGFGGATILDADIYHKTFVTSFGDCLGFIDPMVVHTSNPPQQACYATKENIEKMNKIAAAKPKPETRCMEIAKGAMRCESTTGERLGSFGLPRWSSYYGEPGTATITPGIIHFPSSSVPSPAKPTANTAKAK